MKYDHALSAFDGNANEMARQLNLPASTVLSWRRIGIPPLRQLQLEKVTGGRLKPQPDIFAARDRRKKR